VVVAIIALLMSILLPSLSSAREQARSVVCGQHLRQFGTGLQLYTGENRDWIPGLNTSGAAVTAKRFAMNSDPAALYQSKLPVQTFDWMTPVLAYALELPALRAPRFKFLIDKFRCPSQMYTCSVLYHDTAVPDLDQFEPLGTWPAVSYLMPAGFQYTGQAYNAKVLCHDERITSLPVLAKALPPEFEVRMDEYQPRLDRVGPAARKIFAADGTRFLDDKGELDFDIAPIPNWYGAFSDPGGWWSGAQAYGVRPGSMAWDGIQATGQTGIYGCNGQELPLSYRHGMQHGSLSGGALDNTGTINAVFFDAHVERMSDQQSRQIHHWYPTGGIVQAPAEGMTNVPEGYVIP
jgi:hypothetical protein